MKRDLTNQIVWSDIATAYEKAVVRTSFYDELMKKLAGQLKGCKKILDLGCGVGYLINELMREDPERKITGVDANEYMLEIAREKVIESRFQKNVTLVHGDAVTFEYHEKYDAVVSSNLLFNLKTPYAFLDNAFHNLKPGGRFVLTSARNNPDLGLAIRSMKEEFKADGRFDELEKYANVAEEVNSRFLGEMKTFDNDEIA
ncbi:MAG TPA: class I SAM-dependent methyltransferase, partial [Candidatus Wallbacteria bacterium]|nr:class I SAM-dependent methyltransferase [Candidatus Wallbacteria bacterium]